MAAPLRSEPGSEVATRMGPGKSKSALYWKPSDAMATGGHRSDDGDAAARARAHTEFLLLRQGQ